MPAPRPPGDTMTLVPSTSGDSLISQPSARLSADTTLWEFRIPWTKMRSRLTAIDPKPAPRLDVLHARGGPAAGHDRNKPVSGETADRDGPRHCGQSVPPGLAV